MEPLAAALADAPSPFPAIQWLEGNPTTKLLAQLVAEGHGSATSCWTNSRPVRTSAIPANSSSIRGPGGRCQCEIEFVQ
ncbi:hypothetical protein ACIA6C_15125 [Streptomyces sp. NPDC051578]|uniref:hypothetical protein n=1 Tax=Streptomyces sp. NPDC051578 TaxID=3365662 RepID=UPI003791220D